MPSRADCIFCQIIAGLAPAHHVLDEAACVAFLDARPLFRGHTLVVPREHRAVLSEVPESELGAIFRAAQRISAALEKAVGAEGTFIALNDRISQSVAHVHMHVVPRKKKDGLRNFFWPREKYASEDEAAALAARLREFTR